MKATLTNGVLTISVPKVAAPAASEPKRIEVQEGSAAPGGRIQEGAAGGGGGGGGGGKCTTSAK